MNPPQVYMCFPSWTLLPPPSPFHPSGSSQCTSPKHPVSCIEPRLATHFIHDILHVSMPFSPIFPPSPSPTESIRLFYTSVSLLLSRACTLCVLSRVWLFVTPWSIAHETPLIMKFPRQECWSWLPFPTPGDLPDPRVKPVSLVSLALAGRFFTTSATWEPPALGNVLHYSYSAFAFFFKFFFHSKKKKKVKVLVAQSCLTLCDLMDWPQASLSMEFSRQECWSA